uniref:Uncharacterized protein n=1 Tax=Peronospora matthiolae TaxID=2874970 RepID=A0AAV1TR09_9STRA
MAILIRLAHKSQVSKGVAKKMDEVQVYTWIQCELSPETVEDLLLYLEGDIPGYSAELKHTVDAYWKRLLDLEVEW